MTNEIRQQVFFSLVASAMRSTGIENVLIVTAKDQKFSVSLANAENTNPQTTAEFEHLRKYLCEVFANATGDTNPKQSVLTTVN